MIKRLTINLIPRI